MVTVRRKCRENRFWLELERGRVSEGLSHRESTVYPLVVIHTLTRNGRAGLKNSAVASCSIVKGDLTKKIPLSIALSFLPEVFSITSTST